jgi:hypothetical protein
MIWRSRKNRLEISFWTATVELRLCNSVCGAGTKVVMLSDLWGASDHLFVTLAHRTLCWPALVSIYDRQIYRVDADDCIVVLDRIYMVCRTGPGLRQLSSNMYAHHPRLRIVGFVSGFLVTKDTVRQAE